MDLQKTIDRGRAYLKQNKLHVETPRAVPVGNWLLDVGAQVVAFFLSFQVTKRHLKTDNFVLLFCSFAVAFTLVFRYVFAMLV